MRTTAVHIVLLSLVLPALAGALYRQELRANQLTADEIEAGWRVLFNGETAALWRSASSPVFPEKGWKIADGELTVLGEGGGDIITVEQYDDFEFCLEFKLTPGANSGIKYTVQTGTSLGLEYQLLDDDRHPDAMMGVRGNRTLASLYDLIPAEDRELNPVGEWNRARIVKKGAQVQHWLNGVKVVEYRIGTQMYRALIAKSKYKDIAHFGEFPRGHLLLQDHGDVVSFRNIKIRDLKVTNTNVY